MYFKTLLMVANPGAETLSETLMRRDASIMHGEEFADVMTGEVCKSRSAVLSVTIPPKTVRILAPRQWNDHTERTGHSPY